MRRAPLIGPWAPLRYDRATDDARPRPPSSDHPRDPHHARGRPVRAEPAAPVHPPEPAGQLGLPGARARRVRGHAAVDPRARDRRHRGGAGADRARDGRRPGDDDAPAAVAAGEPADVRDRRRGRVRDPASEPATAASARRRRDGSRPGRVAGAGAAPAVRRLRDHNGGWPDRLPDVEEARAVVTMREAGAPSRPATAAIVSLGCKVNQSEMEAAARLLRQAGVPLVDPSTRADLYLVNTCTVTSTADDKSRAAVRRARRANPDARVVAMGCSVQVDGGRFAAVDAGAQLIRNDEKA